MKKSKGALVVYKNDKLIVDSTAKKAYQQKRAEYLESIKKTMNPALLAAAEKVRVSVDELMVKSFRRAWKMGEFLLDVNNNPQKFGEGGVCKIADYLRYSPSQLYKWTNFRKDYDEKSVERLQELKMANSSSNLSWAHVEVVSKLKDQALRMQSLELAAELDWTPNELDAVIREKFSSMVGGSRHSGGRPLRIPSSYSARLENLDKICHIVLRNEAEMWRHSEYGFLQTIDEVPADKLPKLVSVMDEEAVKVEAATEKLSEVHKELVKARAVAADRLEVQARDVGADEGKTASGKGKGRGKRLGKRRDKNVDIESNDEAEAAQPVVSILDD